MIKLMHINDYVVDTSQFQPLLHDEVVTEFENKIANFVGAKYACSLNSATSAIFLSLFEQKDITITIPSILPPVVANAILCSGNKINYKDDIGWVGNSYILHRFEDYKIIDSAQQLCKDQFAQQANDKDIMIFSFYPTKPVGSSDGGMVVSNDKNKIDQLRVLSRNGISLEENSWERKIILPGWKLYMNSIQAFIANENFKKLSNKMDRLKEMRERYNLAFELNNTSEHLYRINVENNNNFLKLMKGIGVQCGIHYNALHLMDCYKVENASLEKSEFENKTTVSIPYHEKLTNKEIEYIIKEIKPYVITSHRR